MPLVIDADGLNAFVGDPDGLSGRDERDVIITPHPGEMARLVGMSTDEVQANLPLSGGSIGGGLQRGSTLDIAMMLVGKKRTTKDGVTKEDLQGSCDGATHYVRGAMVGAFAMSAVGDDPATSRMYVSVASCDRCIDAIWRAAMPLPRTMR